MENPEARLPDVGVILPAGGMGMRAGSAEPKQFVHLGAGARDSDQGLGASQGKPMLLYTLEAFHRLACVKSIILVLPNERREEYAARLSGFPKVKLVAGGAERWESVRNGFAALDPGLPVVLVHDVARPFVSEAIINRCLTALMPGVCVIAALPAADTVKEISGPSITRTLDRKKLILVQTPQVFPRAILAAVYAAPWAGDVPTDEAQMAERAGYEVRWVLGSESNRKVTGAPDLLWAEWMANRFEAGEKFPDA